MTGHNTKRSFTKLASDWAKTAACSMWTAIMITLAFVVLVVTLNRKIPLKMARKIWGPGILALSGSKVSIEGLDNIDFSKPHIFVSNHQSTLDIPLLFSLLPVNLHFIAKQEIKWFPFVGWYVWAMGMIFIDRKNRERALLSLKCAAKRIQNGANIIAFPEGTRTEDGKVLPFKKGVFVLAIESGVPIVPIFIDGSLKALPKKSTNFTPQNIHITVGKPIASGGFSYDKREDLMHKVRSEIIGLKAA